MNFIRCLLIYLSTVSISDTSGYAYNLLDLPTVITAHWPVVTAVVRLEFVPMWLICVAV